MPRARRRPIRHLSPTRTRLFLVQLLDELTACAQRGENPDVHALAAQHPTLAAELRSLWATVWVAETLARDDDAQPSSASQPGGDPVLAVTARWPASTQDDVEHGQDLTASHGGRSVAAPQSMDQAVSFGDYQLLEELGQGGMGIVYRAREHHRGRIVALKRLLRGAGSSVLDIDRFRVEALAASRLAHPHVVPVFQVGDCDGQPYFTMQYIEGTTLARRLADGPMPGLEAARLLIPVCRAIQYAHDHGILHRDLKPSNILIDREGHPYVSDFGLAKRLDVHGDPSLTPSGALVGTPSYMPPEQARGSVRRLPLAPSCDVYSLGAILYHALTGRPPFQAATPIETMMLVLEEDPDPAASTQPPREPRSRDDRAALPAKTACAPLPERGRRGRRPGGVPARRTGIGPLDQPPRPGGAAPGRDSPCADPGEVGPALDLPQHRTSGLLRADERAEPCRSDGPVALHTSLHRWARWLGGALLGHAAQGGPISFVERQLAHVWGSGIVAINLIFLVEWLLGLPVLSLAPMIAVTNGMLFMVKAGHLVWLLLLPGGGRVPGDPAHGVLSAICAAHLRAGRRGLLLGLGPEIQKSKANLRRRVSRIPPIRRRVKSCTMRDSRDWPGRSHERKSTEGCIRTWHSILQSSARSWGSSQPA